MTNQSTANLRRLPRAEWALTLAIIAAAAVALLWRLGATSLADWDEALYAQISREIVQRGDWLSLHLEGQPYVRKPPLYMWSTAVLYSLFGVSEFWARAASALSGIGVVALTFAIGRRALDTASAVVAVVVLLLSHQFIASARFGTTDVMLTLCIYGAIYGHVRLRDGSRQWWLLIWGMTALAIMVKSVVGGLGLAIVLLTRLVDRQPLGLRDREFWLGAALAAALVLPWHAYTLVTNFDLFMSQYLGHSLIDRATGVIDGHEGNRRYYITRLIQYFSPWVIMVPFALAAEIRRNLRDRPAPASRVLLVTVFLVFAFFTAAQTKLRWYIVPLYPALALIIARWIVEAVRDGSGEARSGLLLAGFLLLLFSPPPLSLAAAAGTGVILLLGWRSGADRVSKSLAFLAALFFTLAGAQAVRPLYASGASASARLGELVATTSGSRERQLIVYVGDGLDRPATVFYSGRSAVAVVNDTQLAEQFAEDEWRDAVLPARLLPQLADHYQIRLLATVNGLAHADMRRAKPR